MIEARGTRMGFSTRAVHSGERQTSKSQPAITPIYASVCFLEESMAEMDEVFAGTREGYVYTRYGNPTTAALERAVADLEGGDGAVAFGSGMAALQAAFATLDLRPEDSIVAARDCYGTTYSLLADVLAPTGVQVTFVDMTHLEGVERTLNSIRPKAVFLETISNPLLRIADLPAIARLSHSIGARVLVDNTFATPYLLRPLEQGADLVIHSATKYLSGHGDVMGGLVVGSAEAVKKLQGVLRVLGGVLGPFEAWLILRGLKTLSLRLERQCTNACHIAEWLADRPEVTNVHYPGLKSHPQHELACRLFRPGTFGGMVSFELAEADKPTVLRFLDALRLCRPATSLGDIYTLLLYPAMSSHRSLTPAQRQAAGISEGLVRLSAGIEDVEDILADLEAALAAAYSLTKQRSP